MEHLDAEIGAGLWELDTTSGTYAECQKRTSRPICQRGADASKHDAEQV
jgi:hypothetical protein